MEDKTGYNVEIRVHPTVFRYIDNNFPKERGIYDLSKTPWHNYISSMLGRSGVKMPSRVSKRYAHFKPVKLLITEFDFNHYGFQISEAQQSLLSRMLQLHIMEEACREVAMLHLLHHIPRRKAVRHYIDANLYEDDELKVDSLLTYYKRKWVPRENELREYWADIMEENGNHNDI